MSCDDLKFLYTECIRNIHSQDYSDKVVKECFETWEKLIKCVNKDIVIPQINIHSYNGTYTNQHIQNSKKDLLHEQ